MRVSQIRTPALILDMDAFERNMQTMQTYLDSIGIALRPHYKSHKSTAIAHMQIQNGAKGLCCAKLGEAEDLVAAGIEDVLLSNQVVAPGKIARVAELAGCCRLTVCVDHAENIANLNAAAALQGTTIHCLVEYNIGMNRCGVQTHEEVHALAAAIGQCSNLVFEGIQAYAGQLSHMEDHAQRKALSEAVDADLAQAKAYLEARGIPCKEISGTSTGTVFFRTKGSPYTEIQAGSYIFMDVAYDALDLSFTNSLFVLASVMSLGSGRVITDAGLKTVSIDQKPAVFHEYPGLPVKLAEEHCSIPAEGLSHAIGDRLLLRPGHCCTTVNLHDHIYLVRQGKVVDRVPVTSRGKSY